ncbi:MAG TPA: dTDP-4-dehydrorhamnose reductase, partial [Casimicrobiaceae bacterium]|nr:dTDP-4-dehydrorhamnose reductase [Casimicrobiaceae bacterium]
MRPILVTGAAGQLGAELVHALAPHGRVVATGHADLDLADPSAIVATLRRIDPSLIVNAAAYTAVDLAEQETDRAEAVNGVAPGVMAEEAKRLGALLVHYSTDYVFDGRANVPYDEDAPARPLSAYGRSKLAGERAIAASGAPALVFRTSWVYGRRGRNFLTTMQRLARERPEIRVVDDQRGVPNWARELA